MFKDLLWECATTSNVQHFHQAMEKLKKLNNDAYEWLKRIPPQSWARSHFTGIMTFDLYLIILKEGKLNTDIEVVYVQGEHIVML